MWSHFACSLKIRKRVVRVDVVSTVDLTKVLDVVDTNTELVLTE